MDDLASRLNDRLRKLQLARSNFDITWDRIARVVLPTSIGFTTSYAPGSQLNNEIFDATAQLALPRFAAAIDTLITPQTSKWHMLQAKDKRMKASPGVQRFLSDLNDKLFAVRYAPKANFASRAFECYMSMGAFGNGPMYIQDLHPGIQYISIHLSEIWFDEDANGRIDTAFWVHEYTQRQVLQKFPDNVPEDIAKDAAQNPNKKIKFCKAVFPRVERDLFQKDAKNMAFASVTFRIGGASNSDSTGSSSIGSSSVPPTIVEEKGYRTFPFAVSRYATAARETYARGPAHDALPDILTLQEMSKTTLRYGQRVADPTLLAADADAVDPFVTRPGAVNYGYLTQDGNELVKQLQLQGDTGFTLELMNQRREAVNTAFLVNLFQVLVDKGGDRRTATEVMQLVQEKGALLGPIGGRLRTEFLGSIIEREMDILFASNVIDPADVPPELRNSPMLDIEYDSPLTRTMKAEEGIGIMRTYEFAAQMAQVNPDIRLKLNANRALERVAEVNGAPPDVLFSDDEVAQNKLHEAAGQAAAAVTDTLPNIADAAKKFAQAQQISRGAAQPGSPQPGVI